MKILNLLKKIKRIDIFTISIFSIGMLISILDKDILNGTIEVLYELPQLSFVIAYLILVLFLFFTVKFFMKIVNDLKFKEKEKIRIYILKGFKLLFIGYYIGFLISITNAFIIRTFEYTSSILM